jgi:predicted nucleic acid-binding protein
MVTAVDSSVLMAIGKGEGNYQAWLELLQEQKAVGRLVVCEVIVAETSALFSDPDAVVPFLQDLQIEYDPLSVAAAILAGTMFKTYRRTGGPREHMIPDFLIGAHALRQSDQLASADRGYFRRHFPNLKVVRPA